MKHSVLFPNFGAEEGPQWRNNLRLAAIRNLAKGWHSLFPSSAKLLLLDSTHEEETPVFSWLANHSGLVPWLSNEEALRVADERRIVYTSPRPNIVQKVHDKAFAVQMVKELGFGPKEYNRFVEVITSEQLKDVYALRDHIENSMLNWDNWTEGAYTLKPRYGTSGRGRVGGRNSKVDEKVLRGMSTLVDRGGAILEPWVERNEDLSAQMYIHRGTKEVEVLSTMKQVVNRSGLYNGNEGIIDSEGFVQSDSQFDEELRAAALKIGERVAAEGFFGPCSVDAFVFFGPSGRIELRPLVEFNARWTGGVVVCGLLKKAENKVEGLKTRRWRYLLEDDTLHFAPLK